MSSGSYNYMIGLFGFYSDTIFYSNDAGKYWCKRNKENIWRLRDWHPRYFFTLSKYSKYLDYENGNVVNTCAHDKKKEKCKQELNFGIKNTLLLNKLKLFNDNELQITNSRSCPRREPLYTEYIIIGNTVLMAEPLRDSSDVTIKFLEDLAVKLIEKD